MTMKAFGATAALAFATVVSAPAQAGTYLFDFTSAPTSSTPGGSCGSGQGSGCGNSFTWTAGTGPSAVSVTATGWSINTGLNPDQTTNAALRGVFENWNGLGVDNRSEPSGSPNHSIDNSGGWIDFILLQFDQQVDLDRINIGWAYNDSDVTVRWGDVGGVWNATPGLHNQPTGTLDALMDGSATYKASGAQTGWREVNSSNETANWWLISALNPDLTNNPDRKTDYFKLKALKLHAYPPIPEPSTWLLMIAGFGAIGGVMRRQRRFAARGQALSAA